MCPRIEETSFELVCSERINPLNYVFYVTNDQESIKDHQYRVTKQ